MTSYIQTTAPVQQERLNLQTLNWVLPLSVREEVVERREPESNGAKWSSLFSLSSAKDCTSDTKASPVSPPEPVFKKPKSGTKNSLDMCTETLGCENGTMYSTEDYKRDGLLCERALGFPTQEEAEERRRERKAMVERRIIKRVRTNSELPPPALTTRTRENFLNIVRERANGRMVMYAVRHQSTVTAERSDGRLKLRLLSSGCSDHDETEEIQDDEGVEGDYLGVVGKEMNGNENGGGGEEAEGKKYVFVGRCKEEEKRGSWTPLMVASAI